MDNTLSGKMSILGKCIETSGQSWLPGATWYEASETGDGLAIQLNHGLLADRSWLWWDVILEGTEVVKYRLSLRQSAGSPAFFLFFGVLPMAQARIRLPLAATDLNRWMFDREGAFLKPLAGGAHIALKDVGRMELTIEAKGEGAARWCMTDILAVREPPPLLADPFLPAGAVADELGQSAQRSWKGKSRSKTEVEVRLRKQKTECASHSWPTSFSRWGGWKGRMFGTTGFFRTHNDGKRWWLVDPDGHPFWSAGVDCVRVDSTANCKGMEKSLTDASTVTNGTVNFLADHLRRTFGDSWHDEWTAITLGQLRAIGFNTIANWSEWEIGSKARFPYVRPLHWQKNRATKDIFRDFPDVFHTDYERDCRAFAIQLEQTVGDPAMIGYFLMNEPTWGFADQVPAEGMLYNTDTCVTRTRFAERLKQKYGDDRTFRSAWQADIGLDAIARGRLATLNQNAETKKDLEEFSTVMTEVLFGTLAKACRATDPNHLNLGARYHTVPPEWAMKGMTCFDVFSINCYITPRVRREIAVVPDMLKCPVLIGEWHFGALDVGQPATGIGRVKTQADREKAYRIYFEDAAAQPWCVGVHWFTLYDQSALGRFDGECYNIGFLDVCNKQYGELCSAARQSHEALYDLASGTTTPFADEPRYLPPLFF